MQEEQVAAGSFDAMAFAPVSDTTVVEIYDPRSKKNTGIKITVYGRDSETYKSVQRRQQNRRFKTLGRARGLQLTAEEVEGEALELLVACTKDWENLDWEGQPLTFNATNCRMVYDKIAVIREQVEDGINERGNFQKG
jgi:hypothetical protein